VLGWLSLRHSHVMLPYALVLAAASFIYIALADLVPDMQRQRRQTESAMQLVLMLAGIALIALLSTQTHAH
jgi:zinc and cadmium transporter